jgi:large subunit ribosomal protein L19
MKAKSLTKETIRQLGVSSKPYPAFNVGDTIIVSQRIKEGDKERTQAFEGDVIAIRKHGASSTFTIRKMGANSVPVERIFPFYSPLIESITFKRKGTVRRSKLYYIRKRVGKAARIQEHIMTKEEKAQSQKAA